MWQAQSTRSRENYKNEVQEIITRLTLLGACVHHGKARQGIQGEPFIPLWKQG